MFPKTYEKCSSCGKKKHVKNLHSRDGEELLCTECLRKLEAKAIGDFLRDVGKDTCARCGAEGDHAGSNTAYLTGREEIHGLCNACKEQLVKDDLRAFAHKIIEPLFNELNRCGNNMGIALALADAIQYQHRYLQGEFFGMLVHLFKLYSVFQHDARNEWAVKIAGVWERCVGRFGNGMCPECNKIFKPEEV